MAKANPLLGVRKWLERAEWSEPFDRLFASHLEAPCKAAAMPVTLATPAIIIAVT
jgi:hypothetical protein